MRARREFRLEGFGDTQLGERETFASEKRFEEMNEAALSVAEGVSR